MVEIKLLNDNSEIVDYNFSHFNIKAKKASLTDYPNMSAINHWHDDFEFTIILNGKMTYFVNGDNYELNQGQAIFVNSNSKITLKEIALSGNICRSNCCEIFQSILNKSPITYLTDYRLEKAIQLLDNSSSSITTIALQCGFNCSSYFTEIFHKKIGCTPSRYRKNR